MSQTLLEPEHVDLALRQIAPMLAELDAMCDELRALTRECQYTVAVEVSMLVMLLDMPLC